MKLNKTISLFLKKQSGLNSTELAKTTSQNNEVFFVNKKFIVKTTPRNWQHYQALEKILSRTSIITPKILSFKKISKTKNLILYPVINGLSYTGLTKINELGWKKIGVTLKKIHSLKLQAGDEVGLNYFFASGRNNFINNFFKYRKLHQKLIPKIISKNDLDKIYTQVLSLTKTKPRTSRLLHGDFVLKNIIFKKNQEVGGIIDWESAQIGDPFLELGYIYLWDGLMTNWKFISASYFKSLKKKISNSDFVIIKKYACFCALILLSGKKMTTLQFAWMRKRLKVILAEI